MYKHVISYRFYLDLKPGSSISPVKKLEIIVDEKIYSDGPGVWKTKCKNFISSKTGINPSQVLDDSNFGIKFIGISQSESTSNNSNKVSQEERDTNRTAAIEADRERRADRAEERERKAIIDERQRLIDIEEAKVRAEQEARERAERRQRANELRSQGKNFQAFLVEFQNGVIGVSVVLGLALFFFFFTQNQKSNMADAMKINSELEQIEDSVKIYINNKNYDKALLLANKLVHSSNEKMEHLEFDSWNGYPKFDEYWTKKREEYKKVILNKGSLNTEKSTDNSSNIENVSDELEGFTEAEGEIMVEGIEDKVYFYDKPNAESITKGYFVKGQQAMLLGTSGDFSKVRFEFNGKVTEKFVQTYQISEMNTNSTNESEENVDPEYQETPYQGQ